MARGNVSNKRFESLKKNGISLRDDELLDTHLKPIKVGKKNSIIELSETELHIRGNLKVNEENVVTAGGDGIYSLNDLSDVTYSDGALTFDFSGDVALDAAGGNVYLKKDGTSIFNFDVTNTELIAYDPTNILSYFKLKVEGNGVTTISTNHFGGSSGKLHLKPNGGLWLTPDSGSVILDATDKLYFSGAGGASLGDTYILESSADVLDFYVGAINLLKLTEAGGGASDAVSILALTPFYFDGGGDTCIAETAADILSIKVGGDTLIQLSEKGDDGNEVSFGSSCVGFTQLAPTYDATTTIVDFRHSNKQSLIFVGGSITNLTSFFPLVSGNFVLLLKQDGTGSRTVTNWKVMEFDESAADGSAAVKWAGGSAPTLTTDANHVDIISFYWDADNEIAYGVATLDFQF